MILPAVRSERYSPPRGGEFRQFVTAGSMSVDVYDHLRSTDPDGGRL